MMLLYHPTLEVDLDFVTISSSLLLTLESLFFSAARNDFCASAILFSSSICFLQKMIKVLDACTLATSLH